MSWSVRWKHDVLGRHLLVDFTGMGARDPFLGEVVYGSDGTPQTLRLRPELVNDIVALGDPDADRAKMQGGHGPWKSLRFL